MKTLDEAVSLLDSSKNTREAISDLHSRHIPTLQEAYANETLTDLFISLLERVAEKQLDPILAMHMAFYTGLVIGIEMEKP